MCLAIYTPAGDHQPLDIDRLKSVAWMNSDGCGIAVPDPDGGPVQIRKIEKSSAYWIHKKYTQAAEAGLPTLIHFRFKTHGAVNKQNSHPFALHRGALAHNGILTLPTYGDLSDTMVLVQMLRLWPRTFYQSPKTQALLNQLCSGNRVAWMEPSGELHVFGEPGITSGGVWFSNGSYLQDDRYYHSGRYVSSWTEDEDDEQTTGWGRMGRFGRFSETSKEHSKRLASFPRATDLTQEDEVADYDSTVWGKCTICDESAWLDAEAVDVWAIDACPSCWRNLPDPDDRPEIQVKA